MLPKRARREVLQLQLLLRPVTGPYFASRIRCHTLKWQHNTLAIAMRIHFSQVRYCTAVKHQDVASELMQSFALPSSELRSNMLTRARNLSVPSVHREKPSLTDIGPCSVATFLRIVGSNAPFSSGFILCGRYDQGIDVRRVDAEASTNAVLPRW